MVATYHYDITPVKPSDLVGLRGLHVRPAPDVLLDWKLYLIQEFCECGEGCGGVGSSSCVVLMLWGVAGGIGQD